MPRVRWHTQTAHRHPNSTSMRKSIWRTFSTRATRYGRQVPVIRQPTPMSFHRFLMRYALYRAIILASSSRTYWPRARWPTYSNRWNREKPCATPSSSPMSISAEYKKWSSQLRRNEGRVIGLSEWIKNRLIVIYMIVSKKTIGLIVLLFIPCFAVGQNSVDSTTVKQDSITIRTDSLCQWNAICNYDTVRKDSCQQQHRLSFVRKGKRSTWSISPNAVKMQKFDSYRKKFTDMRIMETIGSHISR